MQAVVTTPRSTNSSRQVVRLVPSGFLGLLPLQAARTKETQRYALDEFAITYAPSAQALYHARLAGDRPEETLLAVGNPDGSLHFTESEVQAVFECIHFLNQRSTFALFIDI